MLSITTSSSFMLTLTYFNRLVIVMKQCCAVCFSKQNAAQPFVYITNALCVHINNQDFKLKSRNVCVCCVFLLLLLPTLPLLLLLLICNATRINLRLVDLMAMKPISFSLPISSDVGQGRRERHGAPLMAQKSDFHTKYHFDNFNQNDVGEILRNAIRYK